MILFESTWVKHGSRLYSTNEKNETAFNVWVERFDQSQRTPQKQLYFR